MTSENYTLVIPNPISAGTKTNLDTWADIASNIKLSNDTTPATALPVEVDGPDIVTVPATSMVVLSQSIPAFGLYRLVLMITEAGVGEAWNDASPYTPGPTFAALSISFTLPGPIANLDVSQVTNTTQIVKTGPSSNPNCDEGDSTIISLTSGPVLSPSEIYCMAPNPGGDPFPIYIFTDSDQPIPVPPICLAANTVIKTDQGDVLIQDITSKNTINKMVIDKRLSSINKSGDMILIKKGAFVKSKDDKFREPCNDTYITARHRVKDRNGNLVPAKALVNGDTIIHYNMGRNKPVYNVLLKDMSKPGLMIANNIDMETMCPYIYNKVYHDRRAIGKKILRSR